MEKEDSNEKIKYPKAVFFIVATEFCERFSYYGMRAVLTLYLLNVLAFTEDQATTIYHIFALFCYFTCVPGAIIADSLWGKYKTIFYLSLVYIAGEVILSLGSIEYLSISSINSITILSLVGLALISIGTGGIKPCVAAFGGDQFILPQQAKQLGQFFAVFYFSINAGSLFSTLLTPTLRKDVKCFGKDACYPLAFGVPALMMAIALGVYVAGTKLYITFPPKGNVILKVSNCIGHAVSNRFKRDAEKKDHWLDYADDKFDNGLIQDIKTALKVLVLFIPLPFFWALFDQQGSRWTLQARNMNGNFFGMTLKPDQMQVTNPFLILVLIPVFDTIIYPILSKLHLLRKPLQRLTAGGVLAAVAFTISGIIELNIQNSFPSPLTANESQINFINLFPCPVHVTYENMSSEKFDIDDTIEPMHDLIIPKVSTETVSLNFHVRSTSDGKCNNQTETTAFTLVRGKANPVVLLKERESFYVKFPKVGQDLSKSPNMEGRAQTLFIDPQQIFRDHPGKLVLTSTPDVETRISTEGIFDCVDCLEASKYTVTLEETESDTPKNLGTLSLVHGESYIVVFAKEQQHGEEVFKIHQFESQYKGDRVHMLWQVPQYIVMTAGEVMFSVTGLEFAYEQAPSSMKSLMQASWLLTVAFGNLIVVIITEIKIFDDQASEFFLYAALMFLDMMIFAVLACYYKPVTPLDYSDDYPEESKDGFENIAFDNIDVDDEASAAKIAESQ